jgi:hypothetical protein
MEQEKTDLAREPAGGREAFDVSVTIVSYNNKRDIVAGHNSGISYYWPVPFAPSTSCISFGFARMDWRSA